MMFCTLLMTFLFDANQKLEHCDAGDYVMAKHASVLPMDNEVSPAASESGCLDIDIAYQITKTTTAGYRLLGINGTVSMDDVIPIKNAVKYWTTRIDRESDTGKYYFHRAVARKYEKYTSYDTTVHKDVLDEIYVDLLIAEEKNFSGIHLHAFRGSVFHDSGLHKSAIHEYTQCIKKSPGSERFYILRSIAHRSNRMYDESLKDVNRALELNPICSKAFSLRGVLHLDSNIIHKANADFESSIKYDATNSDSYHYKGVMFARNADYKKAIEQYKLCLNHDPFNAIVMKRHITALVHLQQYNACLDECSKLPNWRMQDIDVLNYQGICNYMLNNNTLSYRYHSQAIEVNNKHSKSHYYRSLPLLAERKYIEAENDLKYACLLNPLDKQAIFQYADLLARCPDTKLRNQSAALNIVKKYIQSTESWEGYQKIAEMQNVNGDFKEALLTQETAIKLYEKSGRPTNSDVHRALLKQLDAYKKNMK